MYTLLVCNYDKNRKRERKKNLIFMSIHTIAASALGYKFHSCSCFNLMRCITSNNIQIRTNINTNRINQWSR